MKSHLRLHLTVEVFFRTERKLLAFNDFRTRFDSNENNSKKQNDNNIEKVIQKGEYLYFVTKDGKDKPLESHCKTYPH
jgi:hypothetical protein